VGRRRHGLRSLLIVLPVDSNGRIVIEALQIASMFTTQSFVSGFTLACKCVEILYKCISLASKGQNSQVSNPVEHVIVEGPPLVGIKVDLNLVLVFISSLILLIAFLLLLVNSFL
jgi:hypothetical protein